MKGPVIILALIFTCSAMAAQDDNILSIEPVFVYDRGASGVGGALAYMHGITDIIRVGGTLNWNYMFGRKISNMALRINTDIIIDAFEWVPYLRLSAGIQMPAKTADVQPLLAAGAGLDWRPWPDYSIGLLTELIITGKRLTILQNFTGLVFCFYF